MAAREEVVVGKRFTVVIPKAVRDEVGLKEGRRALVYCEGGRIVTEPLPSDPFEVLAEGAERLPLWTFDGLDEATS